MTVNKKPYNAAKNREKKLIPSKVGNKNLIVIASRAKTTLHPGGMQVIQNSIQEVKSEID